MRRAPCSSSRALTFALTLTLSLSLTLSLRRAFADPPPGDGAPAGLVTFFNGAACPDGWTLAGYAQGRLVLAVTSGVFVGVAVGAPLAPVEDRAHAHGFSAMLALSVKSVSAAGGGNNSAAAAQSYPIAGTTAAAPSGLPFIQLRACEKR